MPCHAGRLLKPERRIALIVYEIFKIRHALHDFIFGERYPPPFVLLPEGRQ